MDRWRPASCASAPPGCRRGPSWWAYRPEALLLAQQGSGLPALEMTVDLVEELGNETLVYGDVRGELASVEIDPTLPPPLPGSQARVCARLAGFTEVGRGQQLSLAVRSDLIHVFDPASGASLSPKV